MIKALRTSSLGMGAGKQTFFSSRQLPSNAFRQLRRNLSTASTVAAQVVSKTPAKASPISFTSSFTTNFILKSSNSSRSTIFRRFLSRTTRRRQSPNPTPTLGSPPQAENLSLSARLKKLSREYGWSALGVYLLLSALDFPFCYLLVKSLGVDRIGRWEEVVVSNLAQVIPDSVKQKWHEWRSSLKSAEKEYTGSETLNDSVEMAGWGVEEAQANNKKDASLATQLALAYAIHKSFIFLRVPLTAAVTPKVVKILRGWGWDIGKRTTKAAKAARKAELSSKVAGPPKA